MLMEVNIGLAVIKVESHEQARYMWENLMPQQINVYLMAMVFKN